MPPLPERAGVAFAGAWLHPPNFPASSLKAYSWSQTVGMATQPKGDLADALSLPATHNYRGLQDSIGRRVQAVSQFVWLTFLAASIVGTR